MFTSAWVPAFEGMAAQAWFTEILERELSRWTKLSSEQMALLFEHYVLLERWNKKINLTSVETGAQMVIRHYCESLFFAAHLPDGDQSIADVGSGAGFPGVPIAILRPACRVTLVESHQRKAVFLKEATRNLSNVSVMSQRAEKLSPSFDMIVSRAVRPEAVIALIPHLAPKIGLMLGADDFREIHSPKAIAWSEPIQLPWGDRRICVFGECSTWNVGSGFGKSHSNR